MTITTEKKKEIQPVSTVSTVETNEPITTRCSSGTCRSVEPWILGVTTIIASYTMFFIC